MGVLASYSAQHKAKNSVCGLPCEVCLCDKHKNYVNMNSVNTNASAWRIFYGRLCVGRWRSEARLDGKIVIITGGNTGIGKETARDLAKRGAHIIIACRDTKKGLAAANDIRIKVPSASVIVKPLDLSSFSSVRHFVEDIKTSEQYVHILINNAGIGASPKWKTEDGFEMQFGVNHLGHFLLTLLLLDRIKESAPARIINVSSVAHIFGNIDFDDINYDKDYHPLKAYCRSKLANILFTRELARRLNGTGVTVYSLHPGAVHTELGRHIGSSMNRFTGAVYTAVSKFFFKSPKTGAQTTIYCAVEESLDDESGFYYSDCHLTEPSAQAKDDETAKRLWDISENLVGLSS